MTTKLAEQLHIWYLEAIKKISPKSYNPNAIKEYSELDEDQKDIDRYIASKIQIVLAQKEKRIRELTDRLFRLRMTSIRRGDDEHT